MPTRFRCGTAATRREYFREVSKTCCQVKLPLTSRGGAATSRGTQFIATATHFSDTSRGADRSARDQIGNSFPPVCWLPKRIRIFTCWSKPKQHSIRFPRHEKAMHLRDASLAGNTNHLYHVEQERCPEWHNKWPLPWQPAGALNLIKEVGLMLKTTAPASSARALVHATTALSMNNF